MSNLFSGLVFVFGHPLNRGKYGSTLIRLLWWKFNQIFLHIPSIIEIADRTYCICRPNSSYGSLIVYTKWPEFDETEYILSNLTTDSIFFDIGAGFGDYSLVASSVIKKGKILSFEPNIKEYEHLQENLRLNGLTNIKAFNQAVCEIAKSVSFNHESIAELGHISYEKDCKTEILITATSIDEVVNNNNISRIDLIKVDVEGAELFVFLGAKNCFKKKMIKQIVFELNPKSTNYHVSRKSTLLLLKKYGYKFSRIQNHTQSDVSIKQILSVPDTQNLVARL